MSDGAPEKKINIPERPHEARQGEEPNALEEEKFEAAKEGATAETPREEPSDTTARIGELLHLRRKPRPTLPQVRDEVTVKIEKILEEGVGDAYSRLSPVAKQEFKLKGEEVARQIRDLVKGAHVKVKKVFQLILEWLKMLPGINRFFLEQEAKIKTDRILSILKKKE